MGKIRKRNSLKWKLLRYLLLSFLLAFFGSNLIGAASNELQSLYQKKFFRDNYPEFVELSKNAACMVEYVGEQSSSAGYLLFQNAEGEKQVFFLEEHSVPKGELESLGYSLVSNAQVVLIPIWVLLCIAVGSFTFYKRELEEGLNVLMHASERIANNELEFEMPDTKHNEIGLVCDSFESMRESLVETNLRNIKIIEESKRLNAAFSHDIRTPITVLKGYVELLSRYLPEGKFSREKECEILELMAAQVSRLENYAVSMSSVQKLEDRIPHPVPEDFRKFTAELEHSCLVVDGRVQFEVQGERRESITVDKEIVFEVVENIVSNAARYAVEEIRVALSCDNDLLTVTVLDDGEGFSDRILEQFGKPFLREDRKEDKDHFGLGIYLSKLLCEKCGGKLLLENRQGAFVQVSFTISQE
ncbi:MAG: ATP-binding protein [Acetatifactor sp.]